jgi:hypothetical protein
LTEGGKQKLKEKVGALSGKVMDTAEFLTNKISLTPRE